ncbi:Peroxiredoxin [Ignavibacterium album JCM 16511]|uniref:Peroxiredoxin n=1 Tax=Ignavibacterium album (strain DSM 19864 / JCM 16511 / NBRC 101810 / Mat9-16) TaxID=945713 RepID=I0AJ89_IGNAJ|nr:peroxiredoxin [Ignavibacterium album]AFH49046.1 Peroxiredoxin [Ignavibacterium album JCM 16511]
MSLKVGDIAPDFTLFNQDAQQVSLNQFKGKKVVLSFFPFANTSVCTKEMCTFRDDMKDYESLDAQVLGISVDSPFALKMFQEKNDYKFPLLSDVNRVVCNLYGTLGVFGPGKYDYQNVSKRSVFVLDRDGVIQYIEILDNPGNEPNYNAIKETLSKIK